MGRRITKRKGAKRQRTQGLLTQREREKNNKTQRRKEAKDAKSFNTEAQWHREAFNRQVAKRKTEGMNRRGAEDAEKEGEE